MSLRENKVPISESLGKFWIPFLPPPPLSNLQYSRKEWYKRIANKTICNKCTTYLLKYFWTSQCSTTTTTINNISIVLLLLLLLLLSWKAMSNNFVVICRILYRFCNKFAIFISCDICFFVLSTQYTFHWTVFHDCTVRMKLRDCTKFSLIPFGSYFLGSGAIELNKHFAFH